MKKKSIMGLEFKWEVFLVYLISILGLIFSFMKDKEVDKDVKLQYNQAGTIFIINIAVSIVSTIVNGFNIPAVGLIIGLALWAAQIAMFVFAIIAIVKAFSNESYRMPVIGDLSEKIFK